MKFSLQKSSQYKNTNSTLVVFAAYKAGTGKKAENQIVLPEIGALNDVLKESFAEKSFKADAKECLFFRNAGLADHKHILCVGLGAHNKINPETLRQATAAAFKALCGNNVATAALHLDSLLRYVKNTSLGLQAAVEGIDLAEYDYDELKEESKRRSTTQSLTAVTLVAGTKVKSASLKNSLEHGVIMADSVNFARWLADSPANYMTPEILAKETQKKAKGTALKVTVWDKARIKKEKMGGLYGVSLGSDFDPRFIIMEYKGAAASKKPVCFVGKGLTFDCGGVSIKPSAGMHEMKYDMCGGTNVIGTMLAIARLKLKINVIGLVPSTENVISGSANKPGDVLTARNGKTVEVLNTDAEGRLILMDALSYASEMKPKAIFDAATLTGAMVVALGNSHTGFFTRDEKLRKTILSAGDASGENVWPMPITDDHVADMKGRHADLSNISSFRGAGSSTAAAFLEQFVDNDIPWAHFDIAGTAWSVSNRLNYCPAQGASGAIVRTFVELAQKV